jgi:hypothetical protein
VHHAARHLRVAHDARIVRRFEAATSNFSTAITVASSPHISREEIRDNLECMTTDALVDQLLSDLKQAQLGDSDFIRFCVDPRDDTTARLVESATLLSAGERFQLRQNLDDDCAFTLTKFAQRRTLQGLREQSRQLLHEALGGYSLLPSSEVPWDTWVRATLFLISPLGEDPDTFINTFDDEASRKRAAIAVSGASRTTGLDQCHLVEVTTSYGVGLVELPVLNDVAAVGWRGAPSLDRNVAIYSPTTNLATIAARLADEIDKQSGTRAGEIRYSQLAAQYFSLNVNGSWLPTIGCLNFLTEDANGASLNVIVAEMSSDFDMASLSDPAIVDENQVAVIEGTCLVLFSPVPNFDDATNDHDVDLTTYEALARTALNESTLWIP